MLFKLETPITALIKTFTSPLHRHGREKVPGVSLGLRITGDNMLLDLLDPDLRPMIYYRDERQEDIPGTVKTTPHLRCKSISLVKMENLKFLGYTVVIHRATLKPIVLGDVKIDDFSLPAAMEGGSINLDFRIGTSALESEDAGWIWAHNGQQIDITVIPPEQPVEPEKPGKGKAKKTPQPDATDAFLAGQNAGNDEAPAAAPADAPAAS